mmetsp:Transcript_8522/g.9961  ORF Transcript_8522/g.9961 Transcript_8522/m.9961 type:complete len:98 (-) Transcript_8522:181-474(-)
MKQNDEEECDKLDKLNPTDYQQYSCNLNGKNGDNNFLTVTADGNLVIATTSHYAHWKFISGIFYPQNLPPKGPEDGLVGVLSLDIWRKVCCITKKTH